MTWTLLVVALTAAAVNVLWDARDAPESYTSPNAIAVLLAVVATGSLLAAPRWPLVSAAVAAAGVLGLTFGEFSRWVAVLGPFLAVPWLAGNLAPKIWTPVAALIAVVGAFALSDEPYVDGYLGATALFFVPCLLLAIAVEFGKRLAVRRVT